MKWGLGDRFMVNKYTDKRYKIQIQDVIQDTGNVYYIFIKLN